MPVVEYQVMGFKIRYDLPNHSEKDFKKVILIYLEMEKWQACKTGVNCYK